MSLHEYIPSNEDEDDNEDFLEEWEDEDGDEDYEVLVETGDYKKGKSKFGLIFFILIIILGGLGGGAYYITTPEGAHLRSNIPASILNMLPMPITSEDPVIVQKKLTDNEALSNDFSAPPMPTIGKDDFDDAPVDFASTMSIPVVDNVIEIEKTEEIVENIEPNNIEVTSINNNLTTDIKAEVVVDLEDRISILEKAVLDVERNMAQKEDIAKIRKQIESEMIALRRDIKKMPMVSAKLSAKNNVSKSYNKQAPKKVSESQKKIKTSKKIASKKIEWVLQSAQPDQAWIAEKGSNLRKKVSVGDNVTSLGLILAIEQDKDTGYWVVRGKTGSVHQ